MATEAPDATIRRVLEQYELAGKLRKLRLKKKLSLVDLGRHTGMSASMLSQLENGKLLPTLPTLARIAMVFDVSLDHFFSQEPSRALFSLVRAGERIRFPDRPDSVRPGFHFEVLAYSAQNKSLEAYLAEFPLREQGDVVEHVHPGTEFLYLIEGSLRIRIDGMEHTLAEGDSAYFDGSRPHAYRGLSRNPARAVVISAPPRP